MIKNSFKRLFRDKSIWIGYLSVMCLLFAAAYFPVSMLEEGAIVVNTCNENAKTHKLQDGYFEVFTPLSDSNIKELKKDGTEIEEHFSFDVKMDDSSVLRIIKPRQKIDIQFITSGKLPKKGEIAIERNYAKKHELHIGEKFRIKDYNYKISAFFALPDYEQPLKNISDMSADSTFFGLAMLDSNEYNKLKENVPLIQAEALGYGFLLGKGINIYDVKEKIADVKVPFSQIKDKEFLRYLKEKRKYIDETLDKLNDVDNGIKMYEDGINKFDKASYKFNNSLSALNLPIVIKGVKDKYLKGVDSLKYESYKLIDKIGELTKKTREKIDEEFPQETTNIILFISAKDNPRILAARDDSKIDLNSDMFASFIVIILCAYAMTVLMDHMIEREKPVIGTLTALGVKKWNLILSYALPPTILAGIFSFIGILGAKYINIEENIREKHNYYSLPDMEVLWSYRMILFGIILPITVTFLVSVFFINKKLKQNTLSLIRNEKIEKSKEFTIKNEDISYTKKFTIKYFYQEKKPMLISLFAIYLALIITMLGFNVEKFCSDITKLPYEVKHEYMYGFRFPAKNLPYGGEEAYTKQLTVTNRSYNYPVTMIGKTKNSKYFPPININSKKEIAISQIVATKLGLKEGDKILLEDRSNDREYIFEVGEIVDYPYGFHVFMPIEKASEIFGKKGEKNTLFSDKKLNINQDKILFKLDKDEIIKQGKIFFDLMKSMIITMKIMGIVFIFFILLQMMKIMVDRARKNISIFKILGYRDGEIFKLYLLPQWIFLMLGTAFCIPLAKLTLNKIYPYLVDNISWYQQPTYTFGTYLFVFMAMAITSFVIMIIFAWRVKKINSGEVLKNRE